MTIELLLALATPSQNEFHYGTHWTKARENGKLAKGQDAHTRLILEDCT